MSSTAAYNRLAVDASGNIYTITKYGSYGYVDKFSNSGNPLASRQFSKQVNDINVIPSTNNLIINGNWSSIENYWVSSDLATWSMSDFSEIYNPYHYQTIPVVGENAAIQMGTEWDSIYETEALILTKITPTGYPYRWRFSGEYGGDEVEPCTAAGNYYFMADSGAYIWKIDNTAKPIGKYSVGISGAANLGAGLATSNGNIIGGFSTYSDRTYSVIVKFDASTMAIIWSKKLPLPYLNHIKSDSQGNIYILSKENGTSAFFVTKLDTSGNLVWNIKVTVPNIYTNVTSTKMAIDPSNGDLVIRSGSSGFYSLLRINTLAPPIGSYTVLSGNSPGTSTTLTIANWAIALAIAPTMVSTSLTVPTASNTGYTPTFTAYSTTATTATLGKVSL